LGRLDPQDPVDFQVKRVCPFLDRKVWMVLLVKMVFLDRKEKGDIQGLEEFLEILRKELLAFQGQLDPLENLAGMEHKANVASQVHLVIRVKLEAAVRTAFQDVQEIKGIEGLMVFQVSRVHVVHQEKGDTQERLERMEIQVL